MSNSLKVKTQTLFTFKIQGHMVKITSPFTKKAYIPLADLEEFVRKNPLKPLVKQDDKTA